MGPRLLLGLTLALCAIGGADAAYLAWDHLQHLVDASYGGGLCGVDSGCALARASALSAIPMPAGQPPLPISLLGLAFYLTFAALSALLARAVRRGPPAAASAQSLHALLLLLAAGGLAYALFLGTYSLIEGYLCPFCAVLYAVNLGLFALALLTRGRIGGARADLLTTARRALGGHALWAAAIFGVVLAPSYLVYRGAIRAAPPPLPSLAAGASASRPTVGPPDAALHIVEFGDFECPHCQAAFLELKRLAAELPDEVRITFLHFPLDEACNPLVDRRFHPRACHLARIAECGHAQGRFIEAAQFIFEHRRGMSDDALVAGLAEQGIDVGALRSCLADPDSAARVKADIERGLQSGVRGTPSVFINGEPLRERLTLEGLKARIEAASTPPKPTP